MKCSKCNCEDIEIVVEPWTDADLKVSTLRTIVKCNQCENWEIIKETDAVNEKLIWFEKENK